MPLSDRTLYWLLLRTLRRTWLKFLGKETRLLLGDGKCRRDTGTD